MKISHEGTKARSGERIRKSRNIDLALAVVQRITPPGYRWTQEDLAEVCGCKRSAIWWIEQGAFHKIRKALSMQGNGLLSDLRAEIREGGLYA